MVYYWCLIYITVYLSSSYFMLLTLSNPTGSIKN